MKPIVGLGLVTLLSAGASAQAYYPNAWGTYSRHRNYTNNYNYNNGWNNGYYNNRYNNGNSYYRYNTYPNNGYYNNYNYNAYPYNNNGYYYNNGYQYNAAGQIINGLLNGALNRW